MSDSYEMLVDPEVELADARKLSRAVIARLRQVGLITGNLTSDCVLGGKGYRPGPAVKSLYKRAKREPAFWDSRTSGVQPRVGRAYNYDALAEAHEGFVCPACGAEIEPFVEDAFEDAVGAALRKWEKNVIAKVRCLHCSKSFAITKWLCRPPLGFGNLSFRFWNWPPLDSPSWQIDICDVVKQITGHNFIKTYGHV